MAGQQQQQNQSYYPPPPQQNSNGNMLAELLALKEIAGLGSSRTAAGTANMTPGAFEAGSNLSNFMGIEEPIATGIGGGPATGTELTLGTGNAAAPGSMLGTLLPAAAVAAYFAPSVYRHGGQILKGEGNSDNFVKGAMMTNPITGWAVPIMDAAGIDIKSGKHKDAYARDAVRDVVRKNTGVYDPEIESVIRLANGGSWDTRNHPQGRSYNIDWSGKDYGVDQKAVDYVVGSLDPLGTMFAGGNEKGSSDQVGEFVNAVLRGGGDIDANIAEIYKNSGLSRDDAYTGVLNLGMGDEATITPEKRNAMLATIDRVYGVPNPNKGKGGTAEYGAAYIPRAD